MANGFEDWVESLGGSVSPDGRTVLRRLFDEHAPISADQAQRLGRDYQLALAREAAALVASDIAATTDVEPPPFEYRDDDGTIRIGFRGRYATTPILGLSNASVTVEVAAFMQGEVTENLHGIWPECRDHATGLHATLSADRAVWICRAGAHVVADIGHLPR